MTDEHRRHLAELEARMQPDHLRWLLSYAGLFQMVHEILKRDIITRVREFYWRGHIDGVDQYNEDLYRSDVLAIGPDGSRPNRFDGSLRWLVAQGVITEADTEAIQKIYQERHVLTHELPRYILGPDSAPDRPLFVDALRITQKIERFWTQLDLAGGTYDLETGEWNDDVDTEEATRLDLLIMQHCIDAVFEPLLRPGGPAEVSDRTDSQALAP